MESRLNIILGAFLVFLLLATGRNLLLKKSGKKQVKAPATTKVLEVADASPKKLDGQNKSSVAATIPEGEKVEPRPEFTPESEKLDPVDLEKSVQGEFCVSAQEKKICERLSATIPSFRGARFKDNHVTIIVDSTSYFLRTRDLLLNNGTELAGSQKEAIASVLLLRDLLGVAKEQIRPMELTLILKKDSMFPDNPETFAVQCSGEGLANQSPEIFSDEKLKAGDFDFSSFCKPN